MSVERIARALEGIEYSEPHIAPCVFGVAWCATCQKLTHTSDHEHPVKPLVRPGELARCDCGHAARVRARQAAAVLEALELGIANAGGVSIVTGREVAIEALERLAGSPRPEEETP